ncbi:MAG: glycerol-3-phosphate dehydrogenase [Prevotellaceae bacterium]|jgi:glycerol-3-phosphate dehydrogenase (NAD(P)+)|nr:glycerol-3-phosphate dehydrogenase [Prevotellaceae bacterium]
MKNYFEHSSKRFGMIGSGSWATALVKVLQQTQARVSWFVRDEYMIEHIIKHQRNPSFLQSAKLDADRLDISSDINRVVAESDVLIFCIPSVYFLNEIALLSYSLDNKFILTAIKGMIPNENITIAEFFNRKHGIPYDNLGVVSGPCHAEEVSMERLSYLTITTKKEEVAKALSRAFSCAFIRTEISTDIYGVEYAVVLKNIYALAAGICHSLGYGDNFTAVLITSAYREMKEFLNKTYPSKNRDTTRSAFLGDLLVTSYSQFSRNRTFGSMLGKGYSVHTAQLEMNMVAEGYYGARCIHELNVKYKVNMPIAEAVYAILYESAHPTQTIRQLTEKISL